MTFQNTTNALLLIKKKILRIQWFSCVKWLTVFPDCFWKLLFCWCWVLGCVCVCVFMFWAFFVWYIYIFFFLKSVIQWISYLFLLLPVCTERHQFTSFPADGGVQPNIGGSLLRFCFLEMAIPAEALVQLQGLHKRRHCRNSPCFGLLSFHSRVVKLGSSLSFVRNVKDTK